MSIYMEAQNRQLELKIERLERLLKSSILRDREIENILSEHDKSLNCSAVSRATLTAWAFSKIKIIFELTKEAHEEN